MSNGYIKAHRILLKHPLWTSEPFTRGQAWIDMLLRTAYSKMFVRIRGMKVDLEPGQLAFSEVEAAKQWQWSRGKVRRFWNELETVQQIEQQKNNVSTVITIVNWKHYQADSTADGQQTDSRRTADGHRKEGKEGIRRDKKAPPFTAPQGAGDAVPAVPEKPRKKKKAPGELSELDRQVAEIWKAYPKKAGKPEGTEAIRKALKKETFEFLLEKTVAYAAAVKLWPRGDNPQYVKHPQGWYNRERYHDDPAVWKRKNDNWY